ncbi:MAG: LCP family protein [Faecalicatena sp.]|uniref:LCP family protein n=1 Tax=Faecalicatena sp. TaxID=2005360 RepID=UPI0025835A0B|nr:LCP family protein [Faecalicatena sp.]MCI6466413.1 LCP family protein [Faecalicatena sp.]MCI7180554.1 LCP family protein [Lachnospiraceae bacterium]MDY5619850.1 LCP family protein [Lachnospiraceae bacterium]
MNKKKKPLHMGGKLLTLLQLLLSVGLLAVVWNSGLLPMKYIIVLGIVLLVLFGITFGLQYLKNKVYIVGLVLSIIISIGLTFGIVYMVKADKLMADVGGATYKTDNMIVVVKNESPANNLLDAKGFRFGMQTAIDQENNKLMQEDIEKAVGREIIVEKYDSLTDEAEALLEGRIEAAIYNEAFAGIIEDSVEGYADQVRILYQYGINTEIEQEETNIEEPFNIYISGIDVAGPITTNSRSDVNIIMTVNPNTKKILLTTTPRDYYVKIPGISGEQKDKLTHAGIYGVDVSMNTLESIYGIDITYYARVNFTSLINIVDALGGVDVNSDYAFKTLYKGFEIQQGMNHLNGEQALGFARERYSFEDGDNQRGRNQEAILTAILNKAMSPAILTNANQIIASVSDSVETNMTQDEMAKFINQQLADASAWSIESIAAAGTGDQQTCYSSGDQILYVMNPDEASVQAAAEKMKQVLESK